MKANGKMVASAAISTHGTAEVLLPQGLCTLSNNTSQGYSYTPSAQGEKTYYVCWLSKKGACLAQRVTLDAPHLSIGVHRYSLNIYVFIYMASIPSTFEQRDLVADA